MDLRKASLHPMLFRTRFTDDVLRKALRALSTDKQFIHRSCDIMDEFKLMTDAELQIYFAQYKVRQDIYTTLENMLTFAVRHVGDC
jgi:SWI/SNF-related matrix-associated actin-dependent regulator 1 of chromatin subfamily A